MTNSLSPTAEREAFVRHIRETQQRTPLTWAEAFAASAIPGDLPKHMEDNFYMSADQKAWLAWQARAALLEPVGEGWVMVPKEPTEAMLRPFYECPPDELPLAWAAMLMVVAASPKTNGGMGS